jgi:hypothetical protein
MQYIIKDFSYDTYYAGRRYSKGEWTRDVNQARVFARVVDAKNSLPYLDGLLCLETIPVQIREIKTY